MGGGSGHSPSPGTAACCEPARPLVGESPGAPVVASAAAGPASVCSLPASSYDSRLLSTYPQLATPRFYNAGYGDQAGAADYANLAVDSSAFYPTLNPAYTMKEAGDPWRGITQPASYYYDPALAAYGYARALFVSSGRARKGMCRHSNTHVTRAALKGCATFFSLSLNIVRKSSLRLIMSEKENAGNRHEMERPDSFHWKPQREAAKSAGKTRKKEQAKWDGLINDQLETKNMRATAAPPAQQTAALTGAAHQQRAKRPSQPRNNNTNNNNNKTHNRPHPSNPGMEQQQQQRHGYGHSMNPYAVGGTSRSPILSGIMSLAPPNALTGYTPAASSDSPSPDLQGLESLMSKSSPNAADDSSGADNSHSKPKIWSLADTATSKSPPPPLGPCAAGQPSGHQTHGTTPKEAAAATGNHGSVLGWFSGGYHHHRGGTPTSGHFGGYASNGFSPGATAPQTDTPPQTPPNAKMNATGASSSIPFHLGSGGYFQGQGCASHLYLGQTSSGGGHPQMAGECTRAV
ncbi:unnamed protein product [Ixodes hexagonus]